MSKNIKSDDLLVPTLSADGLALLLARLPEEKFDLLASDIRSPAAFDELKDCCEKLGRLIDVEAIGAQGLLSLIKQFYDILNRQRLMARD